MPEARPSPRLFEAYDTALDVPGAERLAFVRRQYGSDPELLRQLEEMLRATETADPLLDRPVDDAVAPVASDLERDAGSDDAVITRELAVALAPRYQLQERIGAGGMARVYAALDVTLGRQVAIKALRRDVFDTMGSKRFRLEMDVMVKLDHPHIVPIYEQGQAGDHLYLVLRHVPGGSLRQLLDRGGPVEIARAIAIARDVADALDYAHARHVVHRDVKPDNILLDGFGAYVADFGVARVLEASAGEHLTRTGVVLGTPAYMSPEQLDAVGVSDGRSDVYSLACVLYEMLVGEPPYSGATIRDVIAKHAAAAIPDATVLRSTVTPAMQRVLARALAKSPADRYGTAGEFVTAFERAYRESGAELGAWSRAWRGATALLPTAGTRVAAAAALIGVSALAFYMSGLARPALDDTAVLVLPFQYDTTRGAVAPLQERQRLADAIARWRGMHAADETRAASLLGGQDVPAQVASGASVARRLGAGRLIRGDVVLVADSLRIHAALYDAGRDALLHEATVRVPVSGADLDSAMAELTEILLFGVGDAAMRTACRKTAVPDAYRACIRGHESLDAWRLDGADSAFASAVGADAGFAAAHLWLAQVRAWRREPSARWASSAERAASARAALTVPEQLRSDALLAEARGDLGAACPAWERAVARTPGDFAAWYSLGWCLHDDMLVVRDASSPSGWRFRSSYARALAAYQRAFLLQPSILSAFAGRLFAQVRELFFTTPSVLRRGTSSEQREFLARASWQGDSLLLIPWEADRVHASEPATRPATLGEAVRHQRLFFLDVATAWVAADPQNASALQASALALEMLGDPAARDSLRAARSLARSPAEASRIAAHEVWLDLKQGVPDNPSLVRAARALADTLLGQPPTSDDMREELAALAELTGRATLAARLSGERAREPGDLVARAGATLLAFAALGGPRDSIRASEHALRAAIAALPAARQASARQQWGARAATLVYPDVDTASGPFERGDDPVLDAQLALLRGDTSRARAQLSPMLAHWRRRGFDAVSYDGAYPEFAMLVAMRDDAAAADQMDAMFAALRTSVPMSLADMPAAGAFTRTILLRAETARRLGDARNARTFATIAAALLSDADAFLRPALTRMQTMSSP